MVIVQPLVVRPTPSRTRLALAAFILPGLLTGLALISPDGVPTARAAAGERKLTLFYTAEVHGTLEPCGCTSDPLGDVARYAEVVRSAAREGAVLLVDGGGLSYPEASSGKEKKTDALRADFLASVLPKLGPFAGGLAETDIWDDKDVAPLRLAANLSPKPGGSPAPHAHTPKALAAPFLQTLGGIKVGVFGVADPALAARLGLVGEEPVAAGKREAARLRQAGAELVIALAPVEKPVARRLAREAAVDLVVLGRQVGKGQPRAERVGNAYLLTASEELERVGQLDLVWRGPGPLTDAGGPEAAALRRVEIDAALSRIDAELARWQKEGGGDAAFIAGKRRQRDDLTAERAGLDAPWTPPATGSYFTNRLVPLRRSLPRDPKIAADMRALDKKMAAVNRQNAAPPVPAEPGRAYFVGDAKCASCHKSALAFWKKTVHAGAWRTLVDGGKQDDYRCVSCHVTGYGEVGGSSLGHVAHLESVQCEVCHGPGSIHVAEKGLEDPAAVHRPTPPSTCTTCHNERHSDTFQYEAYLRDILGPGHGDAARKKLGDGVTGHELRTAALKRAKQAGAAQVKKL
jgi:hypothetical protein